MANSIGKDKRTTNSARPSAASRVKNAGAGAAKQAAPQKVAPVDRDVAVAEADEDVEALDVIPVTDDDAELEDDLTSDDRAVSRSGAGGVPRRGPIGPTRGSFLGFLLRMLLLIPGARYVASSVQELSKVTRPTGREAWNMTLVVIAMSAALALLLGAADLGLIQGLQWIVGLGTSSGATH